MIYDREFPFDEIKRKDGDYFNTAQEAMTATGLDSSHVWVIIESDTGNDNEYCYTTSPPHHSHIADCVITKPRYRGPPSTGWGCQGMFVRR